MLSNVVAVIFILEAILKILAMGFVNGKRSYLRDPFNVLDLVILLVQILSWILASNSNFVKSFRALRALKPLRMVSKNDGIIYFVYYLFRNENCC